MTNDIFNFVNKQAGLRLHNRSLDMKTVTSAMRAKIGDIRLHVRQQYMVKTRGERELLRALDGKSYSLRKKMKDKLRLSWAKLSQN